MQELFKKIEDCDKQQQSNFEENFKMLENFDALVDKLEDLPNQVALDAAESSSEGLAIVEKIRAQYANSIRLLVAEFDKLNETAKILHNERLDLLDTQMQINDALQAAGVVTIHPPKCNQVNCGNCNCKQSNP